MHLLSRALVENVHAAMMRVRRRVQMQTDRVLCVRRVRDAVQPDVVADVGRLVARVGRGLEEVWGAGKRGGRGAGSGRVVELLGQRALEHFHDAVCVGVVVDG